ncbi:MAG: hypothetical protein J0L84_14855 [Verrucomicrobia bacterium]|nr:hypothetical protein [Verrucomicrobiota bacterium]
MSRTTLMLLVVPLTGGAMAAGLPSTAPVQPIRVLAADARCSALGAVSDQGRLAAFCSGEGVRVLDWGGGDPVARHAIASAESGPMAASIRGWVAAGGAGRRSLTLQHGVTGQTMASVTSPGAPLDCVSWSPDGAWLAAGDHAGLVTVWDPRSGRLLHRLEGHIASVWALAAAPDGIHLASAGDDNDVCLWDARSGRLVRRWDSFTHSAFALAWAPDGKRLYLGGAACVITAVDPMTGTILGQTSRQPQGISSLALSPDGRLLAAGGAALASVQLPGDIALFETTRFQERRRFQAHAGVVMAVVFAPDGAAIASASEFEPGIKVWAAE